MTLILILPINALKAQHYSCSGIISNKPCSEISLKNTPTVSRSSRSDAQSLTEKKKVILHELINVALRMKQKYIEFNYDFYARKIARLENRCLETETTLRECKNITNKAITKLLKEGDTLFSFELKRKEIDELRHQRKLKEKELELQRLQLIESQVIVGELRHSHHNSGHGPHPHSSFDPHNTSSHHTTSNTGVNISIASDGASFSVHYEGSLEASNIDGGKAAISGKRSDQIHPK